MSVEVHLSVCSDEGCERGGRPEGGGGRGGRQEEERVEAGGQRQSGAQHADRLTE